MYIRVDQLEVGMEVETAVTDASGRVLVAADTLLGDSHLKAFRAWGISAVAIRTADGAGTGRVLIELEIEAFETRFTHVDLEHPAGRALFDICLERAAKRPEAH